MTRGVDPNPKLLLENAKGPEIPLRAQNSLLFHYQYLAMAKIYRKNWVANFGTALEVKNLPKFTNILTGKGHLRRLIFL